MVYDGDGFYYSENGPKLKPINEEYYHPVLHFLTDKLNDGKTPVVCIVGEMGSGKSWAALRIAELLHEELNLFQGDFDAEAVEHSFTFDAGEFVDKVLDVPMAQGEINEERKLFIVDEASDQLNSREWQSDMNMVVNKIIDTQRVRNCMYVFILPDFDSLDKSLKGEVDLLIEMSSNNIGETRSIKAPVKQRSSVDGKGKTWFIKEQQQMRFQPPADDIVDAFNPIEAEAKNGVIERLDKKLNGGGDDDASDFF